MPQTPFDSDDERIRRFGLMPVEEPVGPQQTYDPWGPPPSQQSAPIDTSFADRERARWLPDPEEERARRFGLQPIQPPEPTSYFDRLVSDPAVSLARGVHDVAAAGLGLADIATGGYAGKLVEDYTPWNPQGVDEYLQSLYTPEQKQAFENVRKAEGFLGSIEAIAENASVIPHSIIESIPGMYGGGLAGRVAIGAVAKPLVRAGVRAATVRGLLGEAGALGEGIYSGGSAAEQTRQQDPTRTLGVRGSLAALASGAGTSAIGHYGGKIAEHLGIEDVDISIANSLGKRNLKEAALAAQRASEREQISTARAIVYGFVQEGFLEELPQSVQEQVLANYAAGKDLMDGVQQSAVLGAVVGGVMGGGHAGFSAAMEAPRPKKAPPGTTVAADGTVIPPVGPQGETEDFDEPNRPPTAEQIAAGAAPRGPVGPPGAEPRGPTPPGTRPEGVSYPDLQELMRRGYMSDQIAEMTPEEVRAILGDRQAAPSAPGRPPVGPPGAEPRTQTPEGTFPERGIGYQTAQALVRLGYHTDQIAEMTPQEARQVLEAARQRTLPAVVPKGTQPGAPPIGRAVRGPLPEGIDYPMAQQLARLGYHTDQIREMSGYEAQQIIDTHEAATKKTAQDKAEREFLDRLESQADNDELSAEDAEYGQELRTARAKREAADKALADHVEAERQRKAEADQARREEQQAEGRQRTEADRLEDEKRRFFEELEAMEAQQAKEEELRQQADAAAEEERKLSEFLKGHYQTEIASRRRQIEQDYLQRLTPEQRDEYRLQQQDEARRRGDELPPDEGEGGVPPVAPSVPPAPAAPPSDAAPAAAAGPTPRTNIKIVGFTPADELTRKTPATEKGIAQTLVTAAKVIDPKVSAKTIETTFNQRLQAAQAQVQSARESADDSGLTLERVARDIAAVGGWNEVERVAGNRYWKPRPTGEMTAIKDAITAHDMKESWLGGRFGSMAGVQGVFRKKGMPTDMLLQALQSTSARAADASGNPADNIYADFTPSTFQSWILDRLARGPSQAANQTLTLGDLRIDPQQQWWVPAHLRAISRVAHGMRRDRAAAQQQDTDFDPAALEAPGESRWTLRDLKRGKYEEQRADAARFPSERGAHQYPQAVYDALYPDEFELLAQLQEADLATLDDHERELFIELHTRLEKAVADADKAAPSRTEEPPPAAEEPAAPASTVRIQRDSPHAGEDPDLLLEATLDEQRDRWNDIQKMTAERDAAAEGSKKRARLTDELNAAQAVYEDYWIEAGDTFDGVDLDAKRAEIEQGDKAAPEMVTLYRVQGANTGKAVIPDWIPAETRNAFNRWFTDDPKTLDYYLKDAGDDAVVVTIEVPKSELEQFRVKNQPEEVRRFSRDHDTEFFVSPEYVAKRRELNPEETTAIREQAGVPVTPKPTPKPAKAPGAPPIKPAAEAQNYEAKRRGVADAARFAAQQDKSLPPLPRKGHYRILDALQKKLNREGYDPYDLSESNIKRAIEEGWVKGQKNPKFTDKGRAQLREWQDMAEAHRLALGDLSDKMVDEALAKFDRENQPPKPAAAAAPAPAAPAKPKKKQGPPTTLHDITPVPAEKPRLMFQGAGLTPAQRMDRQRDHIRYQIAHEDGPFFDSQLKKVRIDPAKVEAAGWHLETPEGFEPVWVRNGKTFKVDGGVVDAPSVPVASYEERQPPKEYVASLKAMSRDELLAEHATVDAAYDKTESHNDVQFMGRWMAVRDELRRRGIEIPIPPVAKPKKGQGPPVAATGPATPFTEEQLIALGDAQRGAPEAAMLKAAHALGGGVLQVAIEHVGDLTHRMADRNTISSAGYEFVKEKVDRMVRSLSHKYGFAKEHAENMKGNAEYHKVPLDAYLARVATALKDYAKAHAAIPAYNDAQRVARAAAVALGDQRFDVALTLLGKLQKHLGSVEEWTKYAHDGLQTPPGALESDPNQPRLPGDVGKVRDVEVPTPEIPLPQQHLVLTGEEANTPKQQSLLDKRDAASKAVDAAIADIFNIGKGKTSTLNMFAGPEMAKELALKVFRLVQAIGELGIIDAQIAWNQYVVPNFGEASGDLINAFKTAWRMVHGSLPVFTSEHQPSKSPEEAAARMVAAQKRFEAKAAQSAPSAPPVRTSAPVSAPPVGTKPQGPPRTTTAAPPAAATPKPATPAATTQPAAPPRTAGQGPPRTATPSPLGESPRGTTAAPAKPVAQTPPPAVAAAPDMSAYDNLKPYQKAWVDASVLAQQQGMGMPSFTRFNIPADQHAMLLAALAQRLQTANNPLLQKPVKAATAPAGPTEPTHVTDEQKAILDEYGLKVVGNDMDGTVPIVKIQGKTKKDTYDRKELFRAVDGRFRSIPFEHWRVQLRRLGDFIRALGLVPKTTGRPAGRLPAHIRDASLAQLRTSAAARPDRSGFADGIQGFISPRTQGVIQRGADIGIRQETLDEQKEDVAILVRNYDRGSKAGILASDPGTGKTYVLGGTITELVHRGLDTIVYVTKNNGLVDQAQKDMAGFGIVDRVQFMTYAKFRETEPPEHGVDLLIFDEAHEVKNLKVGNESSQAKQAQQWIANAKYTIMATATPYENPTQLLYLAPTGIFDQVFGAFHQFAAAFGATPILRNKEAVKNGADPVYSYEWKRTISANDDQKAAREWMRKEGFFTSRKMRLPKEQTETHLVKVTGDPKTAELFKALMDAREDNPPPGYGAAWVTNFGKRLLESSKIEVAIDQARKALERGRYPIIFIETKAENIIDINFQASEERRWEEQAAINKRQGMDPPDRKTDGYGGKDGLLPLGIVAILKQVQARTGEDFIHIKPAEEMVQDAFGKDDVAIYTGSIDDAPAQKNLAAWRKQGKPRVLVATMAKGGTGLSLHDKVGDHQTTQINVNLPWTPTGVVQVTQRSMRYGMQGTAESMWLFASNIAMDRYLSKIVGRRLQDMGSLVHGEVADDAVDLDNYNFQELVHMEAEKEKRDRARASGSAMVSWRNFSDRSAGKPERETAVFKKDTGKDENETPDEIRARERTRTLPPVPEGHTRLYRGTSNKPATTIDRTGRNIQSGRYFTSLQTTAEAYTHSDARDYYNTPIDQRVVGDGQISYVDVPTKLLDALPDKWQPGSTRGELTPSKVRTGPGMHDEYVLPDEYVKKAKPIPAPSVGARYMGREEDVPLPYDETSDEDEPPPDDEEDYAPEPDEEGPDLDDEPPPPTPKTFYDQPPKGPATHPTTGEKIYALGLTELFDLSKDWMVIPKVVEKFRKLGQLGVLRIAGDKASIKIKASLFEPGNERELLQVIAHELGHLIDWLPDHVIKRGNLLGHLYTLRKFMEHTFIGPDGRITFMKDIQPELTKVTELWSPYDKSKASDKYRAYRESSPELMAEALSALLTDPKFLADNAPNFFREFMNNLDRKPDVKAAFEAIQGLMRLTPEERAELRVQRDLTTKEAADKKAVQHQQNLKDKATKAKWENWWLRLKTEVIDKHAPVIDKLQTLKSIGREVAEHLNPVEMLKDRNYVGGKIKGWLSQNVYPLVLELDEAGVSWHQFGQFLEYDRTIKGDYKGKLSPNGLQPETAKQNREALEKRFTPEQLDLIEDGIGRFRESVKEVIDEAYAAGLYTPELYKQFKKNPAYATFRGIDYIEDSVTARVYHAKGSAQELQNVANATILKMIVTMRETQNQKVKKSVFDMLEQNADVFPDEFERARRIGPKDFAAPENKDLEAVGYFEHGVWQKVYVDPTIADSLNNKSIGHNNSVMQAIAWANSHMFRPLFVGYNPGFMSFNIVRDFLRTWKNFNDKGHQLSLAGAIARYRQSHELAKIRAFGKPEHMTPKQEKAWSLLTDAEKHFIFGLPHKSNITRHVQETEIKDILARLQVTEEKGPPHTGWKKAIDPVRRIGAWMEKVGNYVETLPKAAAMYEMLGDTKNVEDLTPYQRSYIREKIGTPDVHAGGIWKPVTNELFLFSNVIFQSWRADMNVAYHDITSRLPESLGGTGDPKTRSGWVWKTAALNVLPKMVMMAATAGLMGEWLKKLFAGVSEYDKSNYLIVPFGLDAKGNTIYLRLPQDDTGRFVGGLSWKAMRGDKNIGQTLMQIMDYTGGQLPALTPSLGAVRDSYQMTSGQNPYDAFRSRNLFSDQEMAAGGARNWKKFAGWEFNQLGGSTYFGNFFSEKRPEEKTIGQKILDAPGSFNLLGRWLRVSDYGVTESLRDTKKEVAGGKARLNQDERDEVNDAIRQLRTRPPFEQQKGSQFAAARKIVERVYPDMKRSDQQQKAAEVQKKIAQGLIRGSADPWVDEVMNAGSNAEKRAVIEKARQGMTKEEFGGWLDRAASNAIISRELSMQIKTGRPTR